ncbi:hypothetical protein LCGC14_1184790 [marine sediment metagenome]|uniref:Uncharacterized protein n=1 Tax=marine sediment metagenome TaxID=412755 RepID=A0A0F9LQY4_9ZZZZ
MSDPAEFQRQMMDFLNKSSDLHRNMAEEATERGDNAVNAANKLTEMIAMAQKQKPDEEVTEKFGSAAMQIAQLMIIEASVARLEVALHTSTATLQTTILSAVAAAAIHIREGGMEFDFLTPRGPETPGKPN